MYIIGAIEMLIFIIVIAQFITIMMNSDLFEDSFKKWQNDFFETWRNMSEEEKQKFINEWYHKYD